MHIHTVYFTNLWKNTATTVQTHSHGQGASYGRHAYAAASCRRRDLATAGKTEFVKSEPSLMRKNTDPLPAQKSQPIREQAAALGTKTATEQWRQRRTGVSAHKRQRTEQSRGELTPTLALAGCWVALGWCVCACFPFSFQPVLPAHHVCVCVLPAGQVPLLTTRQRMQRQI